MYVGDLQYLGRVIALFDPLFGLGLGSFLDGGICVVLVPVVVVSANVSINGKPSGSCHSVVKRPY